MSEEDGIVDGDVVAFNPPVRPGIRPARETVQEVARRWVAWCKENREWFEARATLLKQTSPTQFGHLTVGQLADHLSEFAVEKAKAAVAETYARNGWLKPENLDLTSADPAPSLYLPGQTGRREEG